MKGKKLLAGILTVVSIIISLFALDYYTKFVADPQSKINLLLLWLTVILILGKMSGFVERYGQAAVLGELTVGLLLGNLTLIGISFLEPVKADPIIAALSRLGTIVLFFQAGLVSDIRNLAKMWKKALLLAVLGLAFSFALFYFALPYLIPGQSQFVYIFLSFAFSPTGAGVTARVLQDLGKLNLKEAQLMLSSGAIDNIISFIILAVLTAFAGSGSINHAATGMMLIKVLILLVSIIVFCLYILPRLCKFLAQIYPSRSLKFALAFGFTLLASYFAHSVGISPIIGAFVAGLAMSPSYFNYFKPSPFVISLQELVMQNGRTTNTLHKLYDEKLKEAHSRDLEDMFAAPAFLLVAIFFVVTGMGVPLTMFTNPQVVFAALVILVLALVSKFAASAVINKKLVSILAAGMSPRGVTTLVFATAGRNFKIINMEQYALIVLAVMLTTFITPILMTYIAKREGQ